MGKMKMVKNIILGLILLLLIGGAVYYFWPKVPADPFVNLFEFKIVKTDLTDFEKEKYQKQFEDAVTALTEQPDQLDGWLTLGRVKKNLGDFQGAELAWLKAGEVRPKNSISFGNLADLYTNFTKEYEKAESAYIQAIQNSLGEEHNSALYRNFYYFYFYNLEDNQKAEAILKEGIENNSGSSDLLVLLADFYKKTNQPDKAIEYFQKALTLDPERVELKEEMDKLQQK